MVLSTDMSGATAILSRYQEAQSMATKDRQKGIEIYNQIGKPPTLVHQGYISHLI